MRLFFSTHVTVSLRTILEVKIRETIVELDKQEGEEKCTTKSPRIYNRVSWLRFSSYSIDIKEDAIKRERRRQVREKIMARRTVWQPVFWLTAQTKRIFASIKLLHYTLIREAKQSYSKNKGERDSSLKFQFRFFFSSGSLSRRSGPFYMKHLLL